MLVAGIDVGAATAKAVILNENGICSYDIIPTGFDVIEVSREVMESALDRCGAKIQDIKYIISTGYASSAIPFANRAITEILCHAKGAHFLRQDVRTVIDIGGQDNKVVRLDETGDVVDFVMNDKCAAGTGRFFEVMASVLQLDVKEMGPMSLKSEKPSKISSTCTVFAETEMVSLRARKERREDIVAGIHKAAALRIASMRRHVGFREAFQRTQA